MKEQQTPEQYFPHAIQIAFHIWRSHELGALSRQVLSRSLPEIIFFRQLAHRLNLRGASGSAPVHAGHLKSYAVIQTVNRYLIDVLAERQVRDVLSDSLRRGGVDPAGAVTRAVEDEFIRQFPPGVVLDGTATTEAWGASGAHRRLILRELLLLKLSAGNPAVESFRAVFDDSELRLRQPDYPHVVMAMLEALAQGPKLSGFDMTLPEILTAPVKAAPDSLAQQLAYIREQWGELLPPELRDTLLEAADILQEEERERGGGGGDSGPTRVLTFKNGGQPSPAGGGYPADPVLAGYDYPEFERFSPDADWMSNVVMMAKMVYVWLDQLSRQHGYSIATLDQVPDSELDRLASAGFTALWLIGIWERSPASRRIKQLCGNPEAMASAYSLHDYEIAADLGGWQALANLRERAFRRGIRLASDMVPNHTGICSRWVAEHPDWFVQCDTPPFPSYRFSGEDLSTREDVSIQIEDGYWTKSDAAVVFRCVERRSGRTRFIYHGNDGTSFPWNDTAQLNYLLPEVREAVIQTILHVARNFPIIRFDAAMTLAKKHYQRLWFPIRGLGGGIPSRAGWSMSREEFDALFPVEFWREVVDRVAAEVPGTLLLAEAFWLMEGYFVRTLGMHRVYNSAFMNMLCKEENAKYRRTIKNVLEFNHEILKRFVNFMNNPDEKTAVAQFGTQGKYFGACVMMVTMPGLPMFGHGQLEGLREKYGMEYRRAYWDEPVDQGLLTAHQLWIFPLLRRRALFSGSENFQMYDFVTEAGIDDNVFAYSNANGAERTLVFFNNRHATTAGWIKEASPRAIVNEGNGEPGQIRVTLAECLNASPEPDVFLAFRELASGKEYIRHSPEISRQGMYAVLGEYEFQVFLDFRVIRDDENRSWGELCGHLNGRGVEDLNEERLLFRFAGVNNALDAVLKAALRCGAEYGGEEKQPFAALVRAAGSFHSVLSTHIQYNGRSSRKSVSGVAADVRTLLELRFLRPRAKESRTLQEEIGGRLSAPGGICLLASWLLLGAYDADVLDRFGLKYGLRRFLRHQGVEDGDGYVTLLQALLALGQRGDAAFLRQLSESFTLPVCERYLLTHEYDGVVWFNKERFEELALWLCVIRLCEVRAAAGSRLKCLPELGRALNRAKEWALLAGYQAGVFRNLCDGEMDQDQSGVKPLGTPSGRRRTPRGLKGNKK